ELPVSDLRFPRTVKAALASAHTVVFVVPQRCARAGWLSKAVDAPWMRLLARAAKEAEAGPRGSVHSSLNPDAGPARLVLILLPDNVSRHSCAARSAHADDLLKRAEMGKGTTAVLACAEEPAHTLPLARALVRAWPMYSRATNGGEKRTARFLALGADGKAAPLSKADEAVATWSRWAARLVDMPTAELTTADFVRETRKAARGIPHLSVSVLGPEEVRKQGLGGLHAVGRTAIHGPRLLVLRYMPPRAKRLGALIGKGIVYDTGGLSLKTSAGMFGMKADMGGAAAVVGAILALAAGGHKQKVICAAALAENAIGPDAYRPGDILDMHSGKTVEINNTDAEGRLVVADALSYIARKYKPEVLVDMATLTGAQLIATGHRHAAIVSNRAGLEGAAHRAAQAAGDLVHPLPFAPELYQAEFASKVADMRNSVADRMNAQSSCAAQFIYSHIDDLNLPWLHVDMAGPAERDGRATGYGVGLGALLLRQLEAADLK
ncbi:MAG: leucyl aminopeptidase family protein, partial [Planctomycetota bacterium]|nr:leucyl aminopeptidase family protein [Planctomycetota bacterium]